jgi:sugar O-acyltransferase (sialic acid O-acetyltransferase NeuD family)
MEDIVIVGFGGHAKSVADSIERGGNYHIIGYTDLQEHMSKYMYLGTDHVLPKIFDSGVHNAAIGIGFMGSGSIRNTIYDTLKRIGFGLPVIIDPSAIVSESAILGEGTFIGKSAIVNAEATIGKMAIINSKALVEHECVVGEYTHIAVGAVLCGQVKVGTETLIGANATVIQCREIGNHQIVPAGATIR